MPHIVQLPTHLADLIAAGEVVERPASVVKELIENSIDAGATTITVEIQDGGIRFLRVTDDGCGMSREDAPTAFLRHATSKIRTEADLEGIGTLGFRGEALAATSAVSRIDLLTKTHEELVGTSLHLEAGQITRNEEAGCPDGTTIIVRDLFYNTPARMKFLKRDSAEGAAVFSTVQKQALAHPEIAFRFIRDGKTELQTSGDGKLLSAIYSVMGRSDAKEMLTVESRWQSIAISGYVSRPTSTRGNRMYQHFFLNGRYIRNRLLSAALEEAYKNQMMVGRFPACVLHITMPKESVDVNVHPAKTEVKFLSERDLFDAVHYGVLSTLNKASGQVSMQLPKQKDDVLRVAEPDLVPNMRAADPPAGMGSGARTPNTPNIPKVPYYRPAAKPDPAKPAFQTMTAEQYRAMQQGMQSGKPANPKPEVVREVFRPAPKQEPAPEARTPLISTGPAAPAAPASAKTGEPERIPEPEERFPIVPEEQDALPQLPVERTGSAEPVKAAQPAEHPVVGEPAAETAEAAPSAAPEDAQQKLAMQEEDFRIVGEVLNTYIIVEQGDEVLFIDKHAAHERINFERLKSQQQEVMGQLLLCPIRCRLDREEADIILQNRELLLELGYDCDDLGGGTVILRQIPADVDESDAEASLSELAGILLSGRRLDPAAMRDELYHSIACKAAIKAGWHTEPAEREALVRQVMSREDLKYCPHGRPICMKLTKYQIEKQFKRT